MHSHCWESRKQHSTAAPLGLLKLRAAQKLLQLKVRAAQKLLQLGAGGSEELKPTITRRCGPCSLPKLMLDKGRLRPRAISLLSGDASLLWQELVRWLCLSNSYMSTDDRATLCFISIKPLGSFQKNVPFEEGSYSEC